MQERAVGSSEPFKFEKPSGGALLPGAGDLVPFFLIALVPALVILVLTPSYARLLQKRKWLASDVHKPDGRMVPTPAGPLLILGLLSGEWRHRSQNGRKQTCCRYSH